MLRRKMLFKYILNDLRIFMNTTTAHLFHRNTFGFKCVPLEAMQ